MLNEPTTSDPVPSWPANIRYIQNGDALNTTNHQLQAADIAQALGHLKGSITPGAGTYVQKGVMTNEDAGTSSARGVIAIGIGPETGRQPLDLPHGSTLTSVTVFLNRNNTGSLPGTRVTLFVFKLELATGTSTDISGGGYQDPTAILANYEAYHSFTLSGLSEVIDNENYYYFTVLNGEIAPDDTTVDWYGAQATAT